MLCHRPAPPALFKKILELDGFQVVGEDEWNWVLFKEGIPRPIPIPKTVEQVPNDIMNSALHHAKMTPGRYIELREVAELELGAALPPNPPPSTR